jgi:hypothetical protein
VRDLIDVSEVVEEQAAAESIEHMPILAAILVARDARLLQELRGGQHARFQPFGVFGHALTVEPARRPRELGAVVVGSRDRERRRKRIDVRGADVEREVRIELFEIEADFRAQPLRRNHREIDRNPVAPLADRQQAFFVSRDDLRELLPRIDVGGELRTQLLGLGEKRIVGSFERAAHDPVVDVHGIDGAPGKRPARERVGFGGIERKRAVRAQDVGRPHSAQFARGRPRRWKIGGHADDRRLDAALLEHLPERLSLAEQLHTAP